MAKLKVKAFNDALLCLYSAASPYEFSARVHAAFAALFPNICISFDELDYQTGVIVNALDKPVPVSGQEAVERWRRWSVEHPCVVYRRSGGTRTVLQISDFLTERQFSKTNFYNEFWRLLGIRHQLSAVIPLSNRVIAVSVNRDLVFTAAEVELMTVMQPHFVQAYQIMTSVASTQAPSAKAHECGLAPREIEVLGGSWKGNVATGKMWRS